MRRLATAATAFSAAVFAANYVLPANRLPVLAIAAAVAALALSAFFRSRRTRAAIITLFAFAAGLSASMLHSARTTAPAQRHFAPSVDAAQAHLMLADVY